MGQGTSKYRKITRTPQTGENAGKKLWYATAVSDRVDGYFGLPEASDSGRQERPFLRPRIVLHRYDFAWRGEQGEGNCCKCTGRASDCKKHKDLEQRRA